MYDFFHEYFDDVFISEPLKVSSRKGLDENNEILIISSPPTLPLHLS